MRLKGKTALITGAGQGLGFAFANRLADDGADIIVADIAKADAAAEQIRKRGVRAVGVSVDVSKQDEVARAVAEGLKEMGRIDILINNAAFFATMTHGPFENIGVEEWTRMMNVNVLGTYLFCRAVVPQMRKQGTGGRIINMASGTALKGVPGSLHYVTSKGAIIAFTRSLARELGKDNITVNAIAPGLTLSDGVIQRGGQNEERLGVQRRTRAIQRDEKPEDLIGAASFLASDDAAFMTGQTLAVDGGSAMI
ncbi:MAG: dehydrogenase [Gammaproteobacteria bacterium RIFCSPLOWO2_02_FULL_61_13]|nr:MAG: dehydrogenase [Gammaproteobacteria bacterium RIFCSPLOWO2_02_FULL_61_13]